MNYFKSLIIDSEDKEDSYMLHSYIADIYYKIEEFDHALDSYNTALHLTQANDKKVWILSGIASIYAKSKEYNKANKYFNNALQLADKATPTSKIYFDMGVMYFDQNRWQDARKAFQVALETKGNDVVLKDDQDYEIDILWHLGTIAYDIKDYENVIIYLNKILKIIKNNHYYYANSYLTLGHCYLIAGRYEMAREHYNHVLIAPNAYDEEIKVARDGLKQLPLNG